MGEKGGSVPQTLAPTEQLLDLRAGPFFRSADDAFR